MTYSLKNIILHHSYFKNKRCLIACHGHTNNTGANGAGKTSALQLIPVFYGYPPDKVLSKGAGKLSFLDYYLPNTHSMIVFEYLRADGYACAVLYRHPKQAKLIYRFVKGRADETLFAQRFDEHYQQVLPAAELFKSLDADVSHQIETITDYRAILCNEKDRLHKKDRRLSLLAHQFALCAYDKQMHHIGDLTAVLLNNNQLLLKLREMIAFTLIGQDTLSVKPNLSHGAQLIHTINSLRQIHAQSAKLTDAVAQAKALHQLHHTIKQHQRIGIAHQDVLQKQYEQYQQDKKNSERLWQEQERQYRQSLSQISDDIIEVQSKLKQQQKELDALDKEYHDYQQDDMATKSQQVEHLSYYEHLKAQAQTHYDRLSGSQRALVDSYQKDCREIERQTAEQIKQLNEQISRLNDQKDTLGRQEKDALDQLRQDENHTLDQLRDEQATSKERLLSQKNAAHAKISLSGYLTPDEKTAQDEQKANVKKITDDIYHQEIQRQTHAQELDTADKHHARCQTNFERIQEQLTNQKADERHYHQLLYGQNTLMSFLQSSEQDWQTVGKLINPDLLMRTDLSPYWSDETCAGLCGLMLDTSRVELPIYAKGKADIERRLYDIKQNIASTQGRLNDAQKQLTQAKTQKDICFAKQQQAVQKCDELSSKLSINQAVLTDLEHQHAQNATRRTEQATQQYQQICDEYDNLIREQADVIKAKKSSFEDKRRQINHDFAQRQDECLSQINHLKNEQISCQQNAKNQLDQLDVAHQKALSEKGVDEQTLMAAKHDLDIAQRRLQQIQGYEDKVRKYQHWREKIYSQKGAWTEQLYALEDQYERLDQEKQNLQNHQQAKRHEHEQHMAHTDENIDQNQNDQERLGRLLDKTERLFDELGDELVLSVSAESAMNRADFELLIKQLTKELAEQQYKVNLLKAAHQHVQQALQDGDIAIAWHERMARYHHYVVGSTAYYLCAMRELEDMLTHDIVDKTQVSIGEFEALAHDICGYYDKIGRFNSEVKRLSDVLSTKMNHEHNFKALSDIQIHLTSSLSEHTMYRDMRRFYQLYHETGKLSDLPDDELLREFSLATTLLANNNMDTTKTATLIELSISCTEQGRKFVLRHHDDPTKASSTGISTMLIVVLFASLTRHLCSDGQVVVHWPLDEIGRIDSENTKELFEFMNKQGIYLFCAEPELNPIKSRLFICKNDMDKDIGVRHYQSVAKADNPLLQKLQQIQGGMA